MSIAMKFGGTSMGTAESISQVAAIIEKVPDEVIVVVSAISGTTDQLIELGNSAVKDGDFESVLTEIIDKHDAILNDLGLELDLSEFWDDLRSIAHGVNMLHELSPSAGDRLVGMGERISSCILAALLCQNARRPARAMDAFDFIFTDNNFSEANVDFERSNPSIIEKLGSVIEKGLVPVVTGFVAQSEDGRYITLGRGGSDYTCAIIGAALNVDEVQIWTDVDGILNTDPRLVENASVLDQLSFNEAGELAYFGAKVLHPKTIKPAMEKSIPVKILNTFHPLAPGTIITSDQEESLKSVTYKKGISIINVCSVGMLDAHGFLARLFEVFQRHGVSVDVVSTSEVSVSMTVENGMADLVVADLEEFAKVDVQKNMAIICLVGEGIKSDTKVLGRLFSAVNNYDVSMVSQGSSKRNITFLVKEDDAQDVVKTVFNQFFNIC